MSKYMNPYTDYGFKRLFGEEFNKDILIDFLNEILKDETGRIQDITYLNTERLGATELDRGAVFDIYCKSEAGESFIVEMQKAKQNFFKERSVYYATFPIRDQAKKGPWDFDLKAVYTIGILDFVFDETAANDDVISRVKLCDTETQKVFYDKLTFIYLEMPKFNKTENELKTHLDKWLYVFRHLGTLEKRPAKLKQRIFERLFQSAEIAKFTSDDVTQYENSLKHYRDVKNVIDTALMEGEAIGVEKGEAIGIEKGEAIGIAKGEAIGIEKGEAIGIRKKAEETAIKMHRLGMSDTEISDVTGLSVADIGQLMGK